MCDGKVTEQSSRQHRTVDCFMGHREERLTVSVGSVPCLLFHKDVDSGGGSSEDAEGSEG